MSKKRYTFADCVTYAHRHNIAFNFYYESSEHLHYIRADISDGADGYLTATQAIFEFDNFSKKYRATMNLNIRYAYAKDYELMHRLECALNYGDAMKYVRATWNDGIIRWYGALTLNNEHRIAASKIHGNVVWRM